MPPGEDVPPILQCLLVDQGEKLLRRPRPPGCRRGPSGTATASRGASPRASLASPDGVLASASLSAANVKQTAGDDYADEDDYF